MSLAKLKGNDSGTGSVTVQSPNTNSVRTLTLPDADGSIIATDSSGAVIIPRVDSTNEGGQINFNRASDNTTTWSIDSYGNTSTPTLRFLDGANVRMALDGSGNVGIGTSSPGQKLSVAGTVESSTGGFKFPDGTTQITAATAGVTSVDSATGAVVLANLSAFTKSLSSSGYQKLPGGLIFQWGQSTGDGSNNTSVTFPITFPSSVASVILCYRGSQSSNALNTGTVSTSSFTWQRNTGNSGTPIWWFAVGY